MAEVGMQIQASGWNWAQGTSPAGNRHADEVLGQCF
jgi:hypothetical protein